MAERAGVSRWLDDTFKITITIKGVDGVLEAIGGAVLVFVAPATIGHLLRSATQHELSQDPHDFVARHLFRYGTHLAHGSTTFAALYLLSHGLAKLVLVVALLFDRDWAYPGMIALLGAFIVYQCYRLTHRFGVGLCALTVFDGFVVWLTWREWQARKLRRARS